MFSMEGALVPSGEVTVTGTAEVGRRVAGTVVVM